MSCTGREISSVCHVFLSTGLSCLQDITPSELYDKSSDNFITQLRLIGGDNDLECSFFFSLL